jgi:hypothetical protein
MCVFRLITEHVYTAGMSELVKEDCSALAFILGEHPGGYKEMSSILADQ